MPTTKKKTLWRRGAGATRFRKATKLHEILEIALQDLAWVEKQKKLYEVDMGEWHTPPGAVLEEANYWAGEDVVLAAKCVVCFAGSVMACSLKADPEEELDPESYEGDDEVTNKLEALNDLRCGDVESAAGWLFNDELIDVSHYRQLDRKTATYGNDRRQWWCDMKKLLKDLQRADL